MTDTGLQHLGSSVKPLELTSDGAQLLDQTALPAEERYVTITTPEAMADAIRTMIVRGAPAIGIAAAYGLVLGARRYNGDVSGLVQTIRQEAEMLKQSRPTAVNLAWAVNEMLKTLDKATSEESLTGVVEALTRRAEEIHREDIAACHAIGQHGAEKIPQGARILTHCNAGALATGGYGTALGVVRSAFSQDPTIQVFADETRPRLQGARLTTWELARDGIPVTLVTDGMAGHLMKNRMVDVVVVGADRIAANGDAANKIGTYTLALAAYVHDIPFYVAAPLSTIDLSIESGLEIPIEERDPEEIAVVNGESLCAEGIRFYNPAFDVTPAPYITGIITEKGIAQPDYRLSLTQLFQ